MKKISQKIFSVFMVMLMTLFNFLPFIPMMKVHAEELNEIRITSDTDSVSAGVLGYFEAETSTEHVDIEEYGSNTGWSHWATGMSSWHGFGQGPARAVADGTTHYAMRLALHTRDGFEFDSNTRIYFNGVDITNDGYTQLDYELFDWGGYLYIDLGTIALSTSTLTFDVDGGEAIEPITRSDGDVINLPTPVKDGYVFLEWQVRDELETPVGGFFAGEEFEFMEDETVHALWTLDSGEQHAVTFDLNKGGGNEDLSEVNVSHGYRVQRPDEDPTRDGYTFAGWYEDSTGLIEFNFSKAITETTTIYAKWLKNVTITIDVNGGNSMNPNTVTGVEGQTIMEIFGNSGLPDPTHSNPIKYIVGLETPEHVALTGNEIVNDDMTIVLLWGDKHEVTFNLMMYGDENDFVTVYAEDGERIAPIQVPERQGYEFRGWYEDSTFSSEFDFGQQAITGDATFYAKWEEQTTNLADYADVEIGGAVTNMPEVDDASSITVTFENGNTVVVTGEGLFSRNSDNRHFIYALGDVTVEAVPAQGYEAHLRENGNLLDGTTKNYTGLTQANHERIDGEFNLIGENPQTPGQNQNYEDIEFDLSWTNTFVNAQINGITIVEESQDFQQQSFTYEGVVVPNAGNTDAGETNDIRLQPRFGDKVVTTYTINGVDYTENSDNVHINDDDSWTITVPGAVKYTISGTGDDSVAVPRTIIWANVDADEDAENFDEDMLLEHGKAKVIAIYDENHQQVSGVVDVDAETGMGWVPVTPGYEVVFEFIPDYGYQLTSVSANGMQLEAQDTLNQYTFTMPDTNIHFAATFTRVQDVVAANSDKVTSGTIDLSGALNGGTGKLTVNDVNLSEEKIANFEENAGDYEISSYLDIDLYNVFYKGKNDANDVWSSQIDELNKLVTITITLEEGVDGNDIVIVHNVHNGDQYEIISADSYDPETNTITFRTSSFSDFAIASRTVSSDQATPTAPATSETKKTNSPQTSDNVILYVVILLISIAGLISSLKFVKRKN
ncbi:MAG: InlB B-repeat-containing protein [Bacilli bacterium]|nr:InlB B-repeat-containing protein [Bacilli bacterium]